MTIRELIKILIAAAREPQYKGKQIFTRDVDGKLVPLRGLCRLDIDGNIMILR